MNQPPERKPSARLVGALIALAASLLVLAGCGGDDEPESTATGGTQPATDLVEQADAICAEASEQRGATPSLGDGKIESQKLRQAVGFFEDELAITQDIYGRLAELQPPEGLEEPWSVVLAGFQEGVIANYPDVIAAAEAGDVNGFTDALDAIGTQTADLPAAAAEVGLQVCGNAEQ